LKQSRRSIEALMNQGVRPMLSEKFFIYLEALLKGERDQVPTYSDGAPRVVSSSSHIPMELPARTLREDATSPRG
jgi:hypothetical protein